MGATGEEWLDQAQAAFRAGDMHACHDDARRGLAERPEDVRLLRLAAASSLELGLDEAPGYLRRLTELDPGDAQAWRDLGLALVESDVDEALALLSRAVELAPDDTASLRSLIEIQRATGKSRAALARAEQLLDRRPDDLLGLLDVATLRMGMGDFEEARAAFHRLRELAEDPAEATLSYHGMIEVDIRRARWRQALDLAIAATATDRHQLTSDLLAFISTKLFGRIQYPVPAWEELEERLEEGRAGYRRALVEAAAV